MLVFLQKERLKYQKDYMESIKKLEEQWIINQGKQGNERVKVEREDDSFYKTSSREVLQFSNYISSLKLGLIT